MHRQNSGCDRIVYKRRLARDFRAAAMLIGGVIMAVDLEHLYAILAPVARNQSQITYGQLSEEYFQRTEERHDPHGTWDAPLGELNRILHTVRWPSLSAVVVLQDGREPGGGFWESSPNIPRRPGNEIDRIMSYAAILRQVHAAPWPEAIPMATPP